MAAAAAAATVGGCGLGRALCSSRLPGRHRSGGGKGSRPRLGPGEAARSGGAASLQREVEAAAGVSDGIAVAAAACGRFALPPTPAIGFLLHF